MLFQNLTLGFDSLMSKPEIRIFKFMFCNFNQLLALLSVTLVKCDKHILLMFALYFCLIGRGARS